MPDTLFKNIADAIRERFGISGLITPLQFGNKINPSTPVLSIISTYSFDIVMNMILDNTGDAIRAKDMTSANILPNDMPDRILNIPTVEYKTLTVSNAKWDDCIREEISTNTWAQTFVYTYKIYAKSMSFSTVTVDGYTGWGTPLSEATVSKPITNTNYTSSATIKITYTLNYDFNDEIQQGHLTVDDCIDIMDDEKTSVINNSSINITLKGTFVNFNSAG